MRDLIERLEGQLGEASASDANTASEWVPGFFGRHSKLKGYAKIKVVDKEGGYGGTHPEASMHQGEIWLFPKFWKLKPKQRDGVFAHEIGHYVILKMGLAKFIELAQSKGVDPWKTEELPFGTINMDEAFAEAFASHAVSPGELRSRYPKWVEVVKAAMKMAPR